MNEANNHLYSTAVHFVVAANDLDKMKARLISLEARAAKKATDEGSRNEVAIAKRMAKDLREHLQLDCKKKLPRIFKEWRVSFADRLTELKNEMQNVANSASEIVQHTTALDAMCLARDIRDIIEDLSTIEAAFMTAVGKAKTAKTRISGRRI